MSRFVVVAIALGACTVDRSIPDPSTCPRRTLFVNFEGDTLVPGGHDDPDAGVSTNVDDTRTIPPYRRDDPTRDATIQMITDQVTSTLASFPIDVVLTRPDAPGYHMVMVGGHASDVNPAPGNDVIALGADNQDCIVGSPSAITFVFADAIDELNQGAVLPEDGNLIIASYAFTKAIPGTTGDPKDCLVLQDQDPTTPCRIDSIGKRVQASGECGSGSTFDEFGAFALLPCD
jgi:hypothetical protein